MERWSLNIWIKGEDANSLEKDSIFFRWSVWRPEVGFMWLFLLFSILKHYLSSVCLSIYLSFLFLSVHLSIISICICLSTCLLSIYLSVCLCIYLPTYLSNLWIHWLGKTVQQVSSRESPVLRWWWWTLNLYMVAGDLCSGTHAWAASTLLTESSSQTPQQFVS